MAAVPAKRKVFALDIVQKRGVWIEQDIPQLPENFIIVKIEAAAIHPIDIQGLNVPQGPPPQLPPGAPAHVPVGAEAAGIVVAHGPGKGAAFLGKRVAIMSLGAGLWTDYAVVHINDCIIVENPALTWEDCSCAMAYPLTAIMFLELAKKHQSRAVVNTAANSTCGRMILRLLQKNGIEVINLVRRADKAALLAAEGAKYILNTTDADFDKRYVEICSKIGVNLVLECIGGEFLTKITALSPPGTTVCVYGSLAGQPVSTIATGDLFQGKVLMASSVFGFWTKLHSEEKVRQVALVNTELPTTFKSPIVRTFPFAKLDEALKFYDDNKKGASTDGKIILKWA
eukprot:TRINITY_DN0_c2195_g1_i5.p1 TRINITY_DN0_c2195_g1~~TRINITY_DN0_c2195_g1_i5.p1  ORF type:complete len:342 (+),score=130.39 TRINITY_DN0_c2195_g1_i5:63-1088(+)